MLTERTYIGKGYHHQFKNNETGELVYVPCTAEEYYGLGNTDTQPILEGHTWVNSQGGTYKVDTIDGRLAENDYCFIGKDAVVRLPKITSAKEWEILPKQSIENDAIIPLVMELL